jgi:hypothetical protein
MAVVCVPLKRKNKTHVMLIDYEDLALLKIYRWFVSTTGYVVKNFYQSKPRIESMEYMHRLIFNPSKKESIDHINGNKLDNRKINLRICIAKENGKNLNLKRTNKSGYKGVSWDKEKNKWLSKITSDLKQIFLGYFDSKDEAAKAYNQAANKYHKKFAKLNEVSNGWL